MIEGILLRAGLLAISQLIPIAKRRLSPTKKQRVLRELIRARSAFEAAQSEFKRDKTIRP